MNLSQHYKFKSELIAHRPRHILLFLYTSYFTFQCVCIYLFKSWQFRPLGSPSMDLQEKIKVDWLLIDSMQLKKMMCMSKKKKKYINPVGLHKLAWNLWWTSANTTLRIQIWAYSLKRLAHMTCFSRRLPQVVVNASPFRWAPRKKFICSFADGAVLEMWEKSERWWKVDESWLKVAQ